MDDKKKLLVIGALFVVMAGIGAFQFLNSSSPATAVQPKVETPKAVDVLMAPAKNPTVALALAERDPFKPDTLLPLNMPAVPEPVQAQPRPHVRNLPDVQPFQLSGSLPPALGGQIQVKPEMGYTLSGVIVGERPAAVFVDAQGGQRLVPLGSSLDGDTQVVGIERGRVTVRFKGQTIKMIPGGNGSGK